MIKFSTLTEPEEWQWLKERTHLIACEDSQGMVAYNAHGKIVAAAAFDSFTKDNSCNVHMAIDNPMVLRNGWLEEICGHLFLVVKLRRIFVLIAENNVKSRNFCDHIGFDTVARIPHGIAQDMALVVKCMNRADCRWIPAELREAA